MKRINFIFVIIVLFTCFTFVYAEETCKLLDDAKKIKNDINVLQEKFEQDLDTYAGIVNMLSKDNKESLASLANNIMNDGISVKINNIKHELNGIANPNKNYVIQIIENLKADAEKLINRNTEVGKGVRESYKTIKPHIIKEIADLVRDNAKSLGYTVDTNETFNKIVSMLNDSRLITKEIYDSLDLFLNDNTKTYSDVMSIKKLTLILEKLNAGKENEAKDLLKQSISGYENETKINDDINYIITKINSLKSKISSIVSMDDKVIIYFTESQKQTVNSVASAFEQDVIGYTRSLISKHIKNYIALTSHLADSLPIENTLELFNRALDYINLNKDNIENINQLASKIISKVIGDDYDLKHSIVLCGLSFTISGYDIAKFNKSYILKTFEDEIEEIKLFLADEYMDYLSNVDNYLKNEIVVEFKTKEVSLAQDSSRLININRFNTLIKINNLKAKIDETFKSYEGYASDEKFIQKAKNYTDDVIYENMLETIEKIMEAENGKKNKQYEYNSTNYCILTNKFFSKSIIQSMVGLTKEYQNFVKYSSLKDDKIKTGSSMNIKFTNLIFGDYSYIVLGDVYADGRINSQDYMKIKNHVMEKQKLTGIYKLAADTYRDNKIDSRDYMKIKNYVMYGKEINL